MPKVAFSILALCLSAGQALADQAFEGNLLRIDVSYSIDSTTLDDGIDEINILESGFAGIGTYQSAQGFYGELGFGRVTTDEVEVNRQTFDVDDSYSVRAFGLGYRMPRATGEGLYWGFGYRNTKTDESGSDPVNSIRLFWEKERVRRYGIISVAYNTSDDFNLFTVSGRHVWFGESGVGIGVSWGLGAGQTDSGFDPEADIGQASLGALIMFRPRM